MQCYLLSKGHTPRHLETVDRLPEKGYLWLDFRRDNARGWQERVRQLTGVAVKEVHEVECLNAGNSSFFDGTPVGQPGLGGKACERRQLSLTASSCASVQIMASGVSDSMRQ